MFERFSEQARRAMMFAAQEASDFGSRSIAPEHMLLGLIRVDDGLAKRFPGASIQSIREQIQARTPPGEKITFGGNFQYSNEGKRALMQAAEEADRMGDKQIGTEHLLNGIVRDKNSLAQEILRRNIESE